MKKTVRTILGVAVILLLVGMGFFVVNRLHGVSEQTNKMYHVGILAGLDYFGATTDGFKKKMTELGYVEGKNIFYDVQKTPSIVGNQSVIQKFVDNKVDLILTFPTEPSLEAKEVTKGIGIPIISTNAVMEGTALVADFRKPGGNLTGVRYPGPEVAGRGLEILHELVPKAKRVWLPYLKDYPSVPPALLVLEPLARSLGLTLMATPIGTPQELEAYLKTHSTGDTGIDVILQIPEPLAAVPAFTDQLFAFGVEHNIPVGGSLIAPGNSGSLFIFAPDAEEVGELAAPIADKIFRGISAGTIPIVAAESHLGINYAVAQRLGLTVSENLLSRAERILR